jgi:hypothetical protein
MAARGKSAVAVRRLLAARHRVRDDFTRNLA